MNGAPTSPVRAPRWFLVLPVKDASQAKTRLLPLTGDPRSRTDLARAVARDTLEQVCRALPPEQVVVVTSDRAAAATALDLGVHLVADPGRGLNAAVAAGLHAAADIAGRPTGSGAGATGNAGTGVDAGAGTDAATSTGAETEPQPGAGEAPLAWAVLLGDLPALRSADLVAALAACAAYEDAVVPDAEGTGTVLLTSTVVDRPPRPQFGPGSAARHGRTAQVLALDLPRLRRDVDAPEDLTAAVSLGVGSHTSRVLTGDPTATASPGGPRPR